VNVDPDVILAVLAHALLAALRTRPPGYAQATPDTIQARFFETPGQIITSDDAVTARLERRAYSPVLVSHPPHRDRHLVVGRKKAALRVRLILPTRSML
jgi:hypothetical protein